MWRLIGRGGLSAEDTKKKAGSYPEAHIIYLTFLTDSFFSEGC